MDLSHTHVVFVLVVLVAGTLGSLYDPHVYGDERPFFEGWYIRITDNDKPQSFGLLFGNVFPETENSSDPLVVASVLYRQCSSGGEMTCQLQAVNGEYKIDDLTITTKGHSVVSDPSIGTPPNFKWEVNNKKSGGYFQQINGSTYFDFRIDDISFRGQANDPYPWNTDGTGPEGMLVHLPLPLHWFVYSLQSKLEFYEMQNTTSGEVVRGRHGVVHLEKNWGKSFPKRWIWSEGVSSTTNGSFALSGGTVNFQSAIAVDAYLIGYRSPSLGLSLDFTPINSIVTADINGCNGTAKLTVHSLSHKVEIVLSAQPQTFSGCLLGPEAQGFKHACVESYDATAEFNVFERNFFWTYDLVEESMFTGIGLEFGGTYVCNNTCSKYD